MGGDVGSLFPRHLQGNFPPNLSRTCNITRNEVSFLRRGTLAQTSSWESSTVSISGLYNLFIRDRGCWPCSALGGSVGPKGFNAVRRHTPSQPMEYLGILPARDFAGSKLKPEPLRLPRRIHLGHQNDKPLPRAYRPNATKGGNIIRLIRPTTSNLATLVAKFEMLEVSGDDNATTHRQPLNLVPPKPIAPEVPARSEARSGRRTHHKGSDRLAIPVRGASNAATDKITAATLSLAAMIQTDPSNAPTDQEAKRDPSPERSEDGGTSGD